MNDYIDIHTHILYGLDDGAKDLQETRQLLERAYQSGTRTVIFTPHCTDDSFDISKVNERLLSLPPILAEFPELKVYGGSEIMYNGHTAQILDEGRAPTLANSRYVLIEFMPSVRMGEIALAVQDLLTSGYTPVLAHLDRYPLMYKEDISELIETGALIQLNARSVIGKKGFRAKLFCNKLLKNRLVHFIASDCHDSNTRTPELDACARYVEKKYGKQYAHRLFRANGEHILKNETI